MRRVWFSLLMFMVWNFAVFAGGGRESSASGSGTGKTVITVWTHNRHDLAFMQKKVDAYNANNKDNIEVKFEVYTDNYTQAVNLVFQTGEAPDIFSNNGDVFNAHYTAGRFADFNTLMDDEFKNTFKDMMYRDVNVIDGKCYYIPTMATTCRLFYNKDIFKRVGIASPPQTMEELIATARRITTQLKSEGIYGFGINLKSASAGLGRSFNIQGQRELGLNMGFDFAKGEYDFTPYEKMLLGWKELLGPDIAFPGCESLDIDPLRAQFAAGKVAMYFSYTHAEPGVYATQFPNPYDWGAAQIPVSGGVVKGAQYFSPTNGFLLNANSKNLPTAWKVYKELLANLDLLKEYYEEGLGITLVPAVIAVAKPAKIYAENPAMLITPTDAVLPRVPHDINSNAVVVEGMNYYDTWASVIWGQLDARRGLADLTDRYNRAYRNGISQGIGKEVKIPGFNPMKP
jgi:multiple sugar transport system substrate-binding protein